jgi:hypothetical protein
MSDQLDVLKLVTSRLDAGRVEYMITGSIAAGHYGQPRMTRDIDIVVALFPAHVGRLPDLLGPEFLCDIDVARDAISARRTFNVVHQQALQKIDLIVLTDADYEREKFERRQSVLVAGQPMWMISPEDLVLSKLVWAKDSRSELQFRDVRSIMALQPNLDWRYLDRWAIRLTVAGLLQELRS